MKKKSRYPEDWGDLPSVTEVLDCVPKAELIEWFKRTPYHEIKASSDKAKEIGTAFNDLIDAHDKGLSITIETPHGKEIASAVKNYMEWRKLNDFNSIGSQIQVIHRELEYVGTIDRLLEGEGGLFIVDWKVAKRLYLTNKMQVIAYKKAWEHMNKEKISGCILVRLDKENISFNPLTDVQFVDDKDNAMFGCFADMLRFYKQYKLLDKQEE